MDAASRTRGAERSTAWVFIPAITVILGERSKGFQLTAPRPRAEKLPRPTEG